MSCHGVHAPGGGSPPDHYTSRSHIRRGRRSAPRHHGAGGCVHMRQVVNLGGPFTLCSLFTKPGQTEKPGTAIYRQFTRLRQIGHRRTPRYLLHKVRQGAKGEVFGLWAYGVIGAKACGISRLWGVRCVRLRIGVSAGWKVKSRACRTSQGIAKNNRGIWPLVFRIARLVYANR